MNSKILKIITAVLAVVMIVSGVVFVISNNGEKQIINKDPEPVVYSYEQSDYTMSASLSVKGANGEIYLPTILAV